MFKLIKELMPVNSFITDKQSMDFLDLILNYLITLKQIIWNFKIIKTTNIRKILKIFTNHITKNIEK